MASIKSVKQRIKSTKNISQITKAMEVVSATKMRKAQEFAIRARPYAAASLEMLKNLLARTPELPPLLQARPVKVSALLVVTADKGLAGAFNSNVLRKAEAWIVARRSSDAAYTLVTVGKKARDYFMRRGAPVVKSFWGFGDYSILEDTLPVADAILQGFLQHQWDEVDAVYMNFRTTLLQEAVFKKMLPVTEQGIEEAVRGMLPERGRFASPRTHADSTQTHAEGVSVSQRLNLRKSAYVYEYKFEPSAKEILEKLVPQLLRMHVHQIILESNASEHSARMVAMKNASESAGELIDELTLQFNKSRQAGITRELTEITAGKEALEV